MNQKSKLLFPKSYVSLQIQCSHESDVNHTKQQI